MLEQRPPDLFLCCVSDLQCKVGGIGALPLGGKQPLSVLPLEVFTCGRALLCHLTPVCEVSDCTAVGTALCPTLTMSMLATGPGISQTLFSPGHQCRSTEVRSQYCSNHGPRIAVIIYSGYLLTDNSSPLPGSPLRTPHFSTQPPSAPADTRLGLWHAGL